MVEEVICQSDMDIDEMFEINQKIEGAVFSMNTALWMHRLSDRTPIIFDVTTMQPVLVPSGVKVEISILEPELYGMGIEEKPTIFGNMVRVYSQEACICRIIRDKELIDRDIYVNAIKRYAKWNRAKNIPELRVLADAYAVREKVDDYMEILVNGEV